MSKPLALLTGAAGGIGEAVGHRLVARGYQVLAAERNLELASKAAAAIGSDTLAVAADLTSPDEVAALCKRIEEEWAEHLEVVVNNAGAVVPGDVADASHAELDLQLDVMLRSVMHITAASTRVFKAKNRGHVLATVSIGGIIALPTSAAYSASKAGVRAYFAALSAELHKTNIYVSGIYPSAVDTPMLRHEATHGGSLLNWLGKVHSPETVADVYEKALDGHKLEYYIPYSDSILSKIAESFPQIVPPLLPLLNRIGKAGRDKWMRTW